MSRATRTGREIALGLLKDPAYREAFTEAWRTRTVHPTIERHIWEVAYGKAPMALSLEVATAPVPFVISDTDGWPLDAMFFGAGSFERAENGADGLPRYIFKPAPGREPRPDRLLAELAIGADDDD